jgi:Uma2 family endonuclease
MGSEVEEEVFPPGLADYLHVDERNPLSESIEHYAWGRLISLAVDDAFTPRPGSSIERAFAVGNLQFRGEPTETRVAPDVMVIPGAPRQLKSYRPGRDGPPPLACVEILSDANTPQDIERRGRRMLALGCPEVYVLDIDEREVKQLSVVDGEVRYERAVGRHLPGLGITFAYTNDDELAVCCPAGRLATPFQNPWGEVRDEMQRVTDERRRADAERERADAERERADAERARADALDAEVRRLRGDPPMA